MNLWLNIGCGPHLAPAPWVNVDRNEGDYDPLFNNENGPRKPTVVANGWDLPYPDGSCSRLYAGHLVEHLCLPNEVALACAEWRRVMAAGGEILLLAPDLVRIAEATYESKVWDLFWGAHGRAGRGTPLAPAVPGARPGDCHQWSCSREALLLLALWQFAGCEIVPIEPADIPEDWPLVSRADWQAAVLVRCP